MRNERSENGRAILLGLLLGLLCFLSGYGIYRLRLWMQPVEVVSAPSASSALSPLPAPLAAKSAPSLADLPPWPDASLPTFYCADPAAFAKNTMHDLAPTMTHTSPEAKKAIRLSLAYGYMYGCLDAYREANHAGRPAIPPDLPRVSQ